MSHVRTVRPLPPIETGHYRRTGRLLTFAVAAGILLAVLWSYEFVDSVIGDNVANTLLGHDAKDTALAGTAAALLFAFVSGLAGTFTAWPNRPARCVCPTTSPRNPAIRQPRTVAS